MVATTTGPTGTGPIPAEAGIGLRAPHYASLLADRPGIAWLEAHPENYMGAGGPPHRYLTAIRSDYPLAFHGVGLSLGSAEPLDSGHLAALRALADRYQPAIVSEHLSWSVADGVYLNDLLPLPYTEEALDLIAMRVHETQDTLGRRILIENPARYVAWSHSTLAEAEFLSALASRTGCGILLDINNVYVTGANLGRDAAADLDLFPADLVDEIHLAGHHERVHRGRVIRIDDHGSRVCDAVWRLYDQFVRRHGPRPTLIEWDSQIPPLAVLLEEAARAQSILNTSQSPQLPQPPLASRMRHAAAG